MLLDSNILQQQTNWATSLDLSARKAMKTKQKVLTAIRVNIKSILYPATQSFMPPFYAGDMYQFATDIYV